jgi:hypothetical protein
MYGWSVPPSFQFLENKSFIDLFTRYQQVTRQEVCEQQKRIRCNVFYEIEAVRNAPLDNLPVKEYVKEYDGIRVAGDT